MLVLVGMNIPDYGTGLAAAPYRKQKINSGIWVSGGHSKKVCMWLVVAVGVVVDWLLTYAAQQANIDMGIGYVVASLVAVWLICNEIISVLENISDIGVKLPHF